MREGLQAEMRSRAVLAVLFMYRYCLIFFKVEDMSEKDHKLKIRLCQEVLAVLSLVEPGLMLGRGRRTFL